MARTARAVAVCAATLLVTAGTPAGATPWDLGGWSDVSYTDSGGRGLLALGVDRDGEALLVHRSQELPSPPPAFRVARPVTSTELHPRPGSWMPGPTEVADPVLVRIGAEGRTLAVELDGGGDRPLIVRARRGQDGRWEPAQDVLALPAGASRTDPPLDAALSDRGEALIVLVAGGQVLSLRSVGGGWEPPVPLDGPGGSQVQVALTDTGDGIATWSRPARTGGRETVSRRRAPSGRWLPVRRILGRAPGGGVRVALAEDGRALAAWSAQRGVMAASSDPGDRPWRPHRLWPDERRAELMDLGVDGAGRGLLLASRDEPRRGLLKASWRPSSGWREGGLVPGTNGVRHRLSRTRLAVGRLGHAVAISDVFLPGDTTGSARVARRDPGGRWTPQKTIGRLGQVFVGEPLVAVNASGDAAAAWAEGSSNSTTSGEMAFSSGAEQPLIASASVAPSRGATAASLRLRMRLSRPGYVLVSATRPGAGRPLAAEIIRVGAIRATLALPPAVRAAVHRGGGYELRVATGARAGAPAELERRLPVTLSASR